MARSQIQGLRKENEVRRSRLLRDVSSMWDQFKGLILSEFAVVAIGVLFSGVIIVIPALFDILLVVSLLYAKVVLSGKPDVPFRMRKGLNTIDPNDLHPGTGKPMKARGIGFFGNRKEDNAEIWAGNDDMRTHVFVLGSTGAGKTEALTSLAFNALTWCSGFSYVDGKGDVSLWGKIFSMVRQYGREDDLFVINYMTGNADTKAKRADKLSNTYNPFAVGNAESLIQLLVSLMDSAGGGGDMWKGRAISFISAILPALVDLRDRDELLLHIGAIREALPYPRFLELMNNAGISDKSRTMLQSFLYDVPGYKKETGEKQSNTFLEQFGYQQMQFTRILSSLADTYGHIYYTQQGEVNFQDLVRQNRILLVLLPALEKSRPELANLGKIIVAAMKGMMGAELGGRLEGTRLELLDARTTNSPTPFLSIFDELGYYMPDESALMWAQARSLGFSLIAAGQDLQAFYRTSKEETLAIVSNSNIKIFGKLEDPEATFDLFEKRAGKAWVAEVSNYDQGEGVLDGYKGSTEARHVQVSRVDMSDMVNQIEGEVHMLVKSDIIRARMFYAVPQKAKRFRLNHFVKVLPQSEAEVLARKVDTKAMLEALRRHPLSDVTTAPEPCLQALEHAAKSVQVKQYQLARQGAEAGISLLLAAAAAVDDVPNTRQGEETGGSGGLAAGQQHTPGAETLAEGEAVDDGVLDAGAVLLARERAEATTSVPDTVFDGAAVQAGVTAFGNVSEAGGGQIPEDDLAFARAFEPLISNQIDAADDASASTHFLDARATVAALSDMASAMGAPESVARQSAVSVVKSVGDASRYPLPPKPSFSDQAVEEMDNALAQLQALVAKGSQVGSSDGR